MVSKSGDVFQKLGHGGLSRKILREVKGEEKSYDGCFF